MEKIINGKDLVNMQFIEIEDGLLRRYERKGKFVPVLNQRCWFVGTGGSIINHIYNDDIYDKWCLKHNLVFETKKDCVEYKNYLLALDKYSYDFSDEEWEDETIQKFVLYFHFGRKTLSYDHLIHKKRGEIYFKTEDDIEAFRNEVNDEMIEKFMFGYYR